MKAIFFQQRLLVWFDLQGRKDLPWQHPVSPYRVWVSEIMLQQTQVVTVIPYFQRFMHTFPDIKTLANAPLDKVLQHWAGLGYYARARNLHKTAIIITKQGEFPNSVEKLVALPGIGLSTAGAISSIAFNNSAAILDGNVRRVLTRFQALSGWAGTASVNKELWEWSRFYTPVARVADYTQAIMDLGATLCTQSKPQCKQCPLIENCKAYSQGIVAELPTPKPKKKLPIKTLVFLILHNNQQQILLEKRPPIGIWGGLWSLPEFESIKAVNNWCGLNNIVIQQQKPLKTQRHSFTHYHLDYTPLVIYSHNLTNIVMEANQSLWYKAEEINTLALAAPIKQLLQQTMEL
jgi:A/G-specific adenine glycosylase